MFSVFSGNTGCNNNQDAVLGVEANSHKDKARLLEYEAQSRINFAHLSLFKSCLYCNFKCTDKSHMADINNYYDSIVEALRDAALLSIPRIPAGSLKPYWSE